MVIIQLLTISCRDFPPVVGLAAIVGLGPAAGARGGIVGLAPTEGLGATAGGPGRRAAGVGLELAAGAGAGAPCPPPAAAAAAAFLASNATFHPGTPPILPGPPKPACRAFVLLVGVTAARSSFGVTEANRDAAGVLLAELGGEAVAAAAAAGGAGGWRLAGRLGGAGAGLGAGTSTR